MIKAVLFDAGGTLLKPHPSVGRVYAEIAAKHRVYMEEDDLEKKFRAEWKKQKAARLKMDKDWWRTVVMNVFAKESFKDADSFFDDLYGSFSEPARWRIFPDVLPTLTELKTRNITLAVASNWDDRLPRLLRELSLSPHFDHQFISALMGHVKPEPAFFNHALKMLGLDASEVVHVGDDPVEDLTGALGMGIKGVLLDRSAPQSKGDTINTLSDLLRLV
jgi:putative hydrolase of the HAD superfamily